jgi:hypothetical protein
MVGVEQCMLLVAARMFHFVGTVSKSYQIQSKFKGKIRIFCIEIEISDTYLLTRHPDTIGRGMQKGLRCLVSWQLELSEQKISRDLHQGFSSACCATC